MGIARLPPLRVRLLRVGLPIVPVLPLGVVGQCIWGDPVADTGISQRWDNSAMS